MLGLLWMDVSESVWWQKWCEDTYSVCLPVLNTEHMKAKSAPLCSGNKSDWLAWSKGLFTCLKITAAPSFWHNASKSHIDAVKVKIQRRNN